MQYLQRNSFSFVLAVGIAAAALGGAAIAGDPIAAGHQGGAGIADPTASQDLKRPAIPGQANEKKTPEKPFSKPFRFRLPTKDPKWDPDVVKLLGDLDRLAAKWRQASDRSFDERGRPTTALSGYAELRDSIVERLAKKGGHLRVVMTDDKSSMRRRAAFFGLMFVPERQDAIHLLRYIPHEPRVGVRRQAIAQSLAFFEHHAAITKAGQGPQAGYSYVLDLGPWLDLTRAPSTDDIVLGLEALRRFASARPQQSHEAIHAARKWIGSLLTSEHEKVRKATRAWLAEAAPKTEISSDPEQALADYTALVHRLFPAIRLAGGTCTIHPGPLRDQLVEVGSKLLRAGKLGRPSSRAHKTKRGTFHKLGILIEKLPAPLDRLGLAEGDLVTTLNGLPLDGQPTLVSTLQTSLEKGVRSFTLEWITAKGELRVRRYELRATDD